MRRRLCYLRAKRFLNAARPLDAKPFGEHVPITLDRRGTPKTIPSFSTDTERRIRVDIPVEQLRSGNVLYDTELSKTIASRRLPRIAVDVHGAETDGGPGRDTAIGEISIAERQKRYAVRLTLARNGRRIHVAGNM